MHNVEMNEQFSCSAADLWSVVGTLDRVDWVPGIDSAELIGDERHMKMAGDQNLVERIFQHDNNTMTIEYGVVQSAVGLKHHRARLQLSANPDGCTLNWTLEAEPDAFGPAIEKMMRDSLVGIHQVLGDQATGKTDA